MPPRSKLTRCLLIGRHNRGVVFLLVLILFMTLRLLTNLDAFVVFIDSLSYGPLIRRPDHPLYSFSWTEASAELRFGPLSY